MTIDEYNLRMEAYQLSELDHQKDIHMQAFANALIQGTDKSGKPIFKDFDSFYGKEFESNYNRLKERYNPNAVVDFDEQRKLMKLQKKQKIEKEYNLDLLDKLERRVNHE
ncbi:hypothetical protein [Eupransor demetentiae]|uniref:Phage protein n=1 Tax=Eupransor demetentiae TaxID=3109584 RepID=A0ABP0EPC6_9LACO|nr:hypothetical protein R54876_GBNLAHCA_00676 [Lactobacillaceae bacterium LMG 33000]